MKLPFVNREPEPREHDAAAVEDAQPVNGR